MINVQGGEGGWWEGREFHTPRNNEIICLKIVIYYLRGWGEVGGGNDFHRSWNDCKNADIYKLTPNKLCEKKRRRCHMTQFQLLLIVIAVIIMIIIWNLIVIRSHLFLLKQKCTHDNNKLICNMLFYIIWIYNNSIHRKHLLCYQQINININTLIYIIVFLQIKITAKHICNTIGRTC